MKRIDYYVSCFDRYISIKVKAEDVTKANNVMENAYYSWHNDDDGADGFCCEEYILYKLEVAGIEFLEITEGCGVE